MQQKGPLAGQAPSVIHNSRDVPVWDRESAGRKDAPAQQLLLPAASSPSGSWRHKSVSFYLLSKQAPPGIIGSVKRGSVIHCTARTSGTLWNSLLNTTPEDCQGKTLSAVDTLNRVCCVTAVWSLQCPTEPKLRADTREVFPAPVPGISPWKGSSKCERKSFYHFGPFQWGQLLPADWTPHHYKPARPPPWWLLNINLVWTEQREKNPRNLINHHSKNTQY